MHNKLSVLMLLALAAAFVFQCGTGSPTGGASSPKALFNQLKGMDKGNQTEVISLIAPDDRALMACSMDLSVSMAIRFSGLFGGQPVSDETKKQYEGLRKKYNLPQIDEGAFATMQDPAALKTFAVQHYGNLNYVKFMKDFESISQKITGNDTDSQTLKTAENKYAELKDLVIDGDTAKGIVVLDDKTEQPIEFCNVDGKWYLKLGAF